MLSSLFSHCLGEDVGKQKLLPQNLHLYTQNKRRHQEKKVMLWSLGVNSEKRWTSAWGLDRQCFLPFSWTWFENVSIFVFSSLKTHVKRYHSTLGELGEKFRGSVCCPVPVSCSCWMIGLLCLFMLWLLASLFSIRVSLLTGTGWQQVMETIAVKQSSSPLGCEAPPPRFS